MTLLNVHNPAFSSGRSSRSGTGASGTLIHGDDSSTGVDSHHRNSYSLSSLNSQLTPSSTDGSRLASPVESLARAPSQTTRQPIQDLPTDCPETCLRQSFRVTTSKGNYSIKYFQARTEKPILLCKRLEELAIRMETEKKAWKGMVGDKHTVVNEFDHFHRKIQTQDYKLFLCTQVINQLSDILSAISQLLKHLRGFNMYARNLGMPLSSLQESNKAGMETEMCEAFEKLEPLMLVIRETFDRKTRWNLGNSVKLGEVKKLELGEVGRV